MSSTDDGECLVVSEDETMTSENDRSVGSEPSLIWDYYREVNTSEFDGRENLERMMEEILKDAEELQAASEAELKRIYPNPTQLTCVRNKDRDGMREKDVMVVYALSLKCLHDKDKVKKDLYELSRQSIIDVNTEIIVDENVKNFVMSNPYKQRVNNNDLMGSRLDSIFAFVWDSAVLATLQMTNNNPIPNDQTDN